MLCVEQLMHRSNAKEEYTRQLSFLQTQLDAAMKSQSSTHTVEMHKDVVGSTPEAR